MTGSVDPFTAASPIYRDAIRHPHKAGVAFEVTGQRSALAVYAHLILSFAAVVSAAWVALKIIGA